MSLQKDVEVDPRDDELRLLTTKQVAAILGVTQLTVQRYVKSKRLRCIRFGRRNTRFRKQDIAAFQEKHVTTGARSAKPRKKKTTT